MGCDSKTQYYIKEICRKHRVDILCLFETQQYEDQLYCLLGVGFFL